jgi:hypothetical protein
MERLTGVPEPEVIGRHPIEIFPFLQEMGAADLFERARQGEVIETPDLVYRTHLRDLPFWRCW